MGPFILSNEHKKFTFLERKDFKIEDIHLISDIPTRIAESKIYAADLVNKSETFEANSYIDELDFIPNEEIKNFIAKEAF